MDKSFKKVSNSNNKNTFNGNFNGLICSFASNKENALSVKDDEHYKICDGNYLVIVDKKGAQMVSVIVNRKERLWQNENGTWPKHAPILFPHAGECSVIVDGVDYPQKSHGFARDLDWEVVNYSKNQVCMCLKSNNDTKIVFPFDFVFYVTYLIKNNELIIKQTIKNPSDKPIYFFLGGHESYALDEEISNYLVEFENEEIFDHNDRKNDSIVHLGRGKQLDLSSYLLNNSGTIVLHNIKSRKVWLKHKNGTFIAETEFKDFPNLLLWHPTDSKMVCIEPWLNLPDNSSDRTKEFKNKEHVVLVKPFESVDLIRKIKYHD